jgi:hypothetical protein
VYGEIFPKQDGLYRSCDKPQKWCDELRENSLGPVRAISMRFSKHKCLKIRMDIAQSTFKSICTHFHMQMSVKRVWLRELVVK